MIKWFDVFFYCISKRFVRFSNKSVSNGKMQGSSTSGLSLSEQTPRGLPFLNQKNMAAVYNLGNSVSRTNDQCFLCLYRIQIINSHRITLLTHRNNLFE